MEIGNRIAVVGSRQFKNYRQLCDYLDSIVKWGDSIVSGGAVGVDSMAQRYCKERGLSITIIYPDFAHYGRGATFVRNKEIVEACDRVVAFYAAGSFQQGGTANTAEWARKLDKALVEFEEVVLSV
jgi:predicted Rossmann fold nucleotide-binding protein DprA/Smf involved in DNA uptake